MFSWVVAKFCVPNGNLFILEETKNVIVFIALCDEWTFIVCFSIDLAINKVF